MNAVEAIELCRANPEHLRNLAPALFEQVVAEVLAGFGWEVKLTPPTRDGGYDILGVTTDPSGLQTSWLVQCKRYLSGNKVGITTARELLGVKTFLKIPNAVIVTTTHFTSVAQQLSALLPEIQLVDFDKLADWIRRYKAPEKSSFTARQSFVSCFVSHSSKDEEFVRHFVSRLQQENVRVWYAPEDLKPGEKIFEQIRTAIRSFDRLIVVLSENSMRSTWVETEIVSAMRRERIEGRRILFPISIVGFEALRCWQLIDQDSGVDIARELRSYLIPDFSDWKDSEAFEKQIRKVVGALQPVGQVKQEIDVLVQGLRAPYAGDRENAARALGQRGVEASSAVAALRKTLKDSSGHVRNAAAWALAEIGTDDAKRFLKEYDDR